jgi:hypothetical protein|uniref:hypothetical protein n=1 Tax=Prevotella sp. TaxID=59823 RepID=UPI0025EBC2D6|nr:hypothetical protein [Prevotella sp.]
MNKKVYLQPQIKCAPLLMENLLASLSRTEGGNNTGDTKTDFPEMGTPGTDTAKEHFDSFDNWDSWD